jgi:hypothetical protein
MINSQHLMSACFHSAVAVSQAFIAVVVTDAPKSSLAPNAMTRLRYRGAYLCGDIINA